MPYNVSHRFLDKLAVHISKNFLNIPGVRPPLILGIHGRKGEGKTFQCQLVFEKMGFEPVAISAGELESPDAGDPSRLIRLRYREASEQIKVRGEMCALFINDLDAGAGRFDSGTQYTVNTQMVNATLMNIADNPTNVQLPGSYDETPLKRVPIIVTGNDFSTLYAPLIRDGRMEKFFWEPNREERIDIVAGIFESNQLSPRDIEVLIDEFSNQAIDFFSALRGRLYDEQISLFIQEIGIEKVSKRLVNSAESLPQFTKINFGLSHLIELGRAMVGEQNRIRELKLVEEYHQSRLFGKSQKAETVMSSAPPKVAAVSPQLSTDNGYEKNNLPVVGGLLSSDALVQIKQILAGGYRVGLEYADRRRFKTGSWKCAFTLDATEEKEAIAAIENCLAERPKDYIRLIGIDPKVKRRMVETIIQKP